MANRYWRGGSGTWNTSSTTNWSATSGGSGGASVPTAADNVIFDQAGPYTVTLTGALTCLDFSVQQLSGSVTFAGTGTPAISGSMSLVSGTVWSGTGTITFNATTTGKTITTNGTTINGSITLNGVGGEWSLGSALSTGVTLTTTLTNGSLLLNGYDLTTGIFSSNNSNTRSIAFGSTGACNINLTHTTAATVVLSMATLTGFTYTGPGGFTVADMANTRTFTVGTTAGATIDNAPNLTFTTGASVATITTGGWFYLLDYGTTTFTQAATTLNVNSITLSATGTYTALILNIYGTDQYGSVGNILYNGKTTGAVTLLAGDININDVLRCTTFTINGGQMIVSFGTLTPTTSFTIISGSFDIYGLGILSPVPTFTHTAGTVTFELDYALTTTGTYTFTAGTLLIADGITLSTGIFSSNNSNTRTIQFGLYNTSAGNINLTHTTAATTVLSMATLTGFTYTGLGGFTVAAMNNTRTFTCGTTGGTSLIAPNLTFTTGASVATITTGGWFYLLDYGTTTFTQAATTLNIVSALTLSSGGTYTGLTISSTGATTISSGTGTNKTIAALSLNNGSSTTTVDTTGLVVTGAVTMTQGQLLLKGNLSSGSLTCAGSSRSITGTNTTYSITGSGTSAWTFSPSGSILFNGTSQYLSLASTPFVFGTGDFTVEAWIYPTAFRSGTTPTSIVLDNWVSGPSGSYTTGAWTFGAGATGQVAFTYATSSTTTTVISATGAVSLNVWAHIAAVCNSGTITIYVNGAALATGAATVSLGVTGTVGSSVGAQTSLGSTGTRGLWFTGYISNARVVTGVAVYTGAFTVPTGPFTATQTANPFGGSNTSAITGTQTTLLLNTTNYYDYTTDSSSYAYSLTNVNTATYSMTFPAFTTGASGITCSGFTINMSSASAKTFVGGSGTYPTLNQGGAGVLSITGTNTFNNITNTVNGVTVTFPTSTTTTFNNFSLAGIAGSLVTINSSTTSTAATITKSSGIVYGSYLSIRDSTATGGATWYAGPTSTNTSNNTGWIFTRLPIITMGNLTVADGGFTVSNLPV